MQQKKTDPVNTEELPQLTDKQEKFARGILDGLSASEAYRQAYNCENMSDAAIWVDASRLKTHPNVSLWLKTARMAGLAKGVLTHEAFVNRLLELAAKAEESGNYGAAVNAITNAGKAAGHMVDRIEDMTPAERKTVREKLATLASKPPVIITQEEEERVCH